MNNSSTAPQLNRQIAQQARLENVKATKRRGCHTPNAALLASSLVAGFAAAELSIAAERSGLLAAKFFERVEDGSRAKLCPRATRDVNLHEIFHAGFDPRIAARAAQLHPPNHDPHPVAGPRDRLFRNPCSRLADY